MFPYIHGKKNFFLKIYAGSLQNDRVVCFSDNTAHVKSSCFSHVSLHSLCVSVGIVRGRRRVREASRGSVLPQSRFRTLLPRPRSCPLSCWIHLIGRPFLYGGNEAHPVAGVLGGVPIVVIRQLGGAVQQAAVPSRIISRRLKSRVRGGLLALRRPREGVEMGVGGVGHPGWRAGVVAARSGARHCAWGDGTAGCSGGYTGCSAGWSAVGVRRAKLSLVVDDTGLGTGLLMGGGANVVVAVGWILLLFKQINQF